MAEIERNIDEISQEILNLKEIPSNPFSNLHKKISIAERRYIKTLDKTNFNGLKNLKVALISLPELEEVYLKEYWATTTNRQIKNLGEADKRQVCTYSNSYARKLYDYFVESITYAVEKRKANIICINELGLPLNKTGKAPSSVALDFARKIAKKHRCLIIAGSAHNHNSHLNTTYIINPGEDILYHKQVSASLEDELISIPGNRTSYTISAFGINLTVLVCLDIGDFSSVVTAVKGQDYSPHLLFVPSYSEYYEPLAKAAKNISGALSGGVALSNYFSKNRISSFMYMYDGKNPRTPNLIKYFPSNKKPEYSIRFFSFSISYLESYKRSKKGLNNYSNWLYGLNVTQPLS